MADLDVGFSLLLAAVPLGVVLAGERGFLVGEIGGEEGGAAEDVLELAEGFGGGEGRGFVDCCLGEEGEELAW